MKERLKNPLFWSGLAGFVWTIGISKMGIITQEDFKTVVDLIAYVLLGAGIYTNFTPTAPKEEKEGGGV